MFKIIKTVIIALIITAVVSAALLAEGTNVGGHVKAVIFDYTYGIHQDEDASDFGTQSNGAGFLAIVLYIYH